MRAIPLNWEDMAEKSGNYGEPEKGGESTQPVSTSQGDLESFAERLRETVGQRSARAFARDAGISDRSLREYMNAQTEPSRPALVGMARAGGVSIDWLATGGGAKLQRAVGEESARYEAVQDYAFVPLYDVSASAGQGAFVNAERTSDALAFKRDWLRQQIGGSVNDLAIISVRGDSMEPTLRDGDVIMVNRADRQVTEGIYVLLLDGWLMVKRLQREVIDGVGKLMAYSENEAYPPFAMPTFEGFSEPTGIIGRVVWAGRRL